MSEREIRAILREAFAELDRRAARVARTVVIPSLLGASLALGAGCGHRAVQPEQDGSAQLEASAGGDAGTRQRDGFWLDNGPQPAYFAPQIDAGVAPPPEPDYMAPLYMAPEPDPDGGR